MSLFHKYESCIGIPLFKSKCRYVELWYCPKGYVIKEHSHPNEHIELMYIFGKTIFYRRNPETEDEDILEPAWFQFMKCFTVPAGFFHYFKVSNLPLIFINFSRFLNNTKPTSASVDFKLKI